ncbi:lipopolysaccharide biosynthesis protein [Pedobacter panaciterrae]|uniref:Wzz/FepE/Etk N-terminal domain-containing protein n=1 Tax=Pedobacter panaciterrae TaxID=363849 RepID=UPI00155D91A4|nr:Wzz/FepE/Etk N-terminal domain-containing protein [Pedobacter panaciterrae]NQX55259.1 lipopolysaccharide biosynthesis protein [Pedobacter panaciterrae]
MKENLPNNLKSQDISLGDIVLKLKSWYQYLLSKWRTILLFFLIGGVMGFLLTYFKKPVYTATTTFVLEEGGAENGGGQYAALASLAGINLGGGGGGIFQVGNIVELYKSRKMIESTLLTEVDYEGKKKSLIDIYIDFNSPDKSTNSNAFDNDSFKSKDVLNPIIHSRSQDSILGRVVNDINNNYLKVFKPEEGSSIIRVDIRSQNEFFAKTFNDEIVKNVSDFYLKTKTKKSLDNVMILQKKTDSIRAVMNGAIYTAAMVSDATPNLNPTRQMQRAVPVQKSQFNAEANKAILSELVKNLELSKMNLLRETPLLQIVDHPVFPLNSYSFGRVKSFILGGIIAGFITCIVLIMRRLFNNISR